MENNPFSPNMKVVALHAALELEKLNVDKVDDVSDGKSLVDEAKVIHDWLTTV
jgi:hypothetical protein